MAASRSSGTLTPSVASSIRENIAAPSAKSSVARDRSDSSQAASSRIAVAAAAFACFSSACKPASATSAYTGVTSLR